MKHTPSPWVLCGPDDTPNGRVWRVNGWHTPEGFNTASDCRLADVFSVEANARIIVYAPELLAALETLVAGCQSAGHETGVTWALEQSRAAIALARGEA